MTAHVPGEGALAEAVMEMVRAHQPHPKATRANQRVSCGGISDPLTGHFCQFAGSAREQLAHATGRVAELLAAHTPAAAADRDGAGVEARLAERSGWDPIEGISAALGLPPAVEAILREFPLDATGHVAACGYDDDPIGDCRCGSLPQRIAAVLGPVVADETARAVEAALREAAIRLVSPDHLTPMGARMLRQALRGDS